MITLKGKDGQGCVVHGTRALQYLPQARRSSGKTRLCRTTRQLMHAQAHAALDTALICGYTVLHTVEDANRRDVVVDIQLPLQISEAVKEIERICLEHGKPF